MRIYNNTMVSFQRRIGERPLDALKKESGSKAQENTLKAQYDKEVSIKSPTERLLSTYFDVEV